MTNKQNVSQNNGIITNHIKARIDKTQQNSKYRLCGKVTVILATLVEGDTKAPFSIGTTPMCRGEHYSIPKIALLYA